MPTLPPLSAREVYQLLKDVALGVRSISRGGGPAWRELEFGAFTVNVESWQLTVFNESGDLDHCVGCTAPDGRTVNEETWARYGTDPIHLLSRWEREQLERQLREC